MISFAVRLEAIVHWKLTYFHTVPLLCICTFNAAMWCLHASNLHVKPCGDWQYVLTLTLLTHMSPLGNWLCHAFAAPLLRNSFICSQKIWLEFMWQSIQINVKLKILAVSVLSVPNMPSDSFIASHCDALGTMGLEADGSSMCFRSLKTTSTEEEKRNTGVLWLSVWGGSRIIKNTELISY